MYDSILTVCNLKEEGYSYSSRSVAERGEEKRTLMFKIIFFHNVETFNLRMKKGLSFFNSEGVSNGLKEESV